MYKTGGLEPTGNPAEIMSIDGLDYVVSDKFKMMLRDSLIDWGTFLEIYNDNLDFATLYDQMVKLLNVKENENLREMFIPLVKKIYHLDANAHMACMLKQFMIYEPVSIAVSSLFTTIKLHYESLVLRFLHARNKYILTNNLPDKTNNIDELLSSWSDMNEQYGLESSSIILLFLNPPKNIKNNLHLTIKSKKLDLKSSIRKFHYPGFCPKVPHERLKKLMEFPVSAFCSAIKSIDPDAKFPNYARLEKITAEHLSKIPSKPKIQDTYERKKAPELEDKIQLAKWYIDEIFNLRKSLADIGKQYEEYYIKKARIISEITDEIKKEFSHLHNLV